LEKNFICEMIDLLMSEEKTPREKFAGLKFSQIKGSDVQDNNGMKIGNLQDACFRHVENGLELTKFIIGGSMIEEILEDIGLRPDVDPVFPIANIKGVSPKGIRLNVTKDKLKSTTLDTDAIEADEFRLSSLGKFKIVDSNGESIGNIIDITFSRNAFQFIIGDGFIKELAEDLGLLSDVDLLLENSFISDFNIDTKTIKLNKGKLALKETFEKHVPTGGREAGKNIDHQYEEVRKSMYFPRSQF